MNLENIENFLYKFIGKPVQRSLGFIELSFLSIIHLLKFWGMLFGLEMIIFSIIYSIFLPILFEGNDNGLNGSLFFVALYHFGEWYFLYSLILVSCYQLFLADQNKYFGQVYATLFALHFLFTTSLVSFSWDSGLLILILGMMSAFSSAKLTVWYLNAEEMVEE